MCDHYVAPGSSHYCNDGNFDFSSYHPGRGLESAMLGYQSSSRVYMGAPVEGRSS